MKHRKFVLHVSLFLTIGLMAFAGVMQHRAAQRASDIYNSSRALVGSLFLAEYAHLQVGLPRPVDDIDYSNQYLMNQWETQTNSRWMVEQARLIVPYLVYENISIGGGIYPVGIGFVPMSAGNSFHILGRAMPTYRFVYINERFLFDVRRQDRAMLYSTLVHELVHIQGGAFISGHPEDFEAKTSAATLEALAGMCNYSNKLACQAFWMEVEDMARAVVRVELRQRDQLQLYEWLSDVLWRTNDEEIAARKAGRYWASNPDRLDYIFRAYAVKPWEQIVVPGILEGKRINTELVDWSSSKILGMSFDDTYDLLGWLFHVVKWTYMS